MTDSTIQVRKRHNDDAAMDIGALDRQSGEPRREMKPSTAVAVASWYLLSRTVGGQLAAFASGTEVDRHALLDDTAAATVRADHNGVWSQELELLSAFIMNRAVEREGSCCTDCLMTILMTIANDDSTEIEDRATWRAGVERLDATDGGRLHAVPAGNSSSWFGTTDCDYCGSALHGDRHAIVFLT